MLRVANLAAAAKSKPCLLTNTLVEHDIVQPGALSRHTLPWPSQLDKPFHHCHSHFLAYTRKVTLYHSQIKRSPPPLLPLLPSYDNTLFIILCSLEGREYFHSGNAPEKVREP